MPRDRKKTGVSYHKAGETIRGPLREEIEANFRRFNEIYSQLQHAEDRVAAIAALAYFEEKLETALRLKFVPLSKDMHRRLFKGYGPLSTVAAKIDLAFALGIIDGSYRSDLRMANKVRNMFAHSFEPLKFEDSEVSDVINSMTTPDKVPNLSLLTFDTATPRSRYLTTLQWIGMSASWPREPNT